MLMQLLTIMWAMEKSLLGMLVLVGLGVLAVHLSVRLEFVQDIQLVVQGWQ